MDGIWLDVGTWPLFVVEDTELVQSREDLRSRVDRSEEGENRDPSVNAREGSSLTIEGRTQPI